MSTSCRECSKSLKRSGPPPNSKQSLKPNYHGSVNPCLPTPSTKLSFNNRQEHVLAMKALNLTTLLCAAILSSSQAGTVVAPNGYASTAGPNGLNTLLRGTGAPRLFSNGSSEIRGSRLLGGNSPTSLAGRGLAATPFFISAHLASS